MIVEAWSIWKNGKGQARKRLVAGMLHIAFWPILLIPRLFWPKRRRPQNISRIMLIRMDGIGDLAMSAAIFPALRHHFPHAQIDLLTSKEAHGIAEFFLRAGWLNAIHLMPLRGRSINGYRELARQFRALQYDAAIDLRGDLRNIALMWLAGIPIRIGMPASGLTYLLTDIVPVVGPHHQSEEPIALVRALGVHQVSPQPTLPLQSQERIAADQWLVAHSATSDRMICAFHLGAFYPSKIWPLDRFIAVGKYFREKHDAQLLVVGGPSEANLASEFAKAFDPNRVMIAVGEASLSLTAALLARCAMFIGNDSGPAHIAAEVGCPVVALFGPANPVEYRPLGKKVAFIKSPTPCDPRCGKVCMRGDSHCMLDHSVTEVIQEAERVMTD